MVDSVTAAGSATVLIALSLYVWRIAYFSSDWAVLALLPLILVIYTGSWRLMHERWKAQLRVALRDDSPISRFLTGKIGATVLSVIFTAVAILVLAWQSLSVTPLQGAVLIVAALLSGCVFSVGQAMLARHFYQPFARTIAVSAATWFVAVPFTLIIAIVTYAWTIMPGAMLTASFAEALQIGIDKLLLRGGRIADLLGILYRYEAIKLWLVVQLREYPLAAGVFSLDAAFVSFVLCRVSIVVTHFVGCFVTKGRG